MTFDKITEDFDEDFSEFPDFGKTSFSSGIVFKVIFILFKFVCTVEVNTKSQTTRGSASRQMSRGVDFRN